MGDEATAKPKQIAALVHKQPGVFVTQTVVIYNDCDSMFFMQLRMSPQRSQMKSVAVVCSSSVRQPLPATHCQKGTCSSACALGYSTFYTLYRLKDSYLWLLMWWCLKKRGGAFVLVMLRARMLLHAH